jgi:hypothetical protein
LQEEYALFSAPQAEGPGKDQLPGPKYRLAIIARQMLNAIMPEIG